MVILQTIIPTRGTASHVYWRATCLVTANIGFPGRPEVQRAMSIGAQPVPSDKTQHTGADYGNRWEEFRQTIQATIRLQVAAMFNQALADQMMALLRRPKGQHRSSLIPQPTDLVCPACGRHMTLDFVYKGHDKRSQLTLWGWLDLSVPRAECICGHCLTILFDVLSAHNRLW